MNIDRKNMKLIYDGLQIPVKAQVEKLIVQKCPWHRFMLINILLYKWTMHGKSPFILINGHQHRRKLK